MEPLLEGFPLKHQDGKGLLRRTLSEKLADLEAAERAHLEDVRVGLVSTVRHSENMSRRLCCYM